MLQPIDRIPNTQMLWTAISQRSSHHRRRYWSRPTKLVLGKSLELVNDQ